MVLQNIGTTAIVLHYVAQRSGKTVTEPLKLQVETGKKGKKVVAVAFEWPGLSRGAKTKEAAIEMVVAYIPRYAPVADIAGLGAEFAQVAGSKVDEEYVGTGSTDFWGISFGHSDHDKTRMSDAELERNLALLQAAWFYFDQTRARVSPEMRKGPRGGGKDRDQIARHTVYAELDMAWKVGIQEEWDGLMDEDRLAAYRARYVAAIRQYHAEDKPSRNWPLRFVIRHSAFHTLDHTWEMEDKDLS
jgi:hypothetical protein